MADIAALGLEVRSDQVEKGSRALDNLTASAKKAEAATKGVAAASKTASAAASDSASKSSAAAAALDAEASAARSAADAARMHAAANSNQKFQWESSEEVAKRLGLQMKEVSSATESATDAINSQSTAAENAAGSAAEAASNMDKLGHATEGAAVKAGLLKTVLSALWSGLGRFLLSALSVAVGVLIAELGKLVDWAGLAKSALNMLANAVEVVAPYAAMAAAGLALIYAPAIVGGIISLIGLFGQLSIGAIGAAAAMAAANPAAALVLGITAAVAAATIFRDELTQIFGIDIVGAAKTGANYVIGSFVAAFEDLKFVWNQFPNIVGAAAVGAANAAISGIESMLNAASGLLDSFIERVNSALSMLPGGFSIGKIGTFDFGEIANPYADALRSAVGDRNKAVQDALSRDYLGEFGSAISSGASAAADKLRELAGRFGGVEEAADGAGKAAKDAAYGAKDPWKGLRNAVDGAKEAMRFARDVVGGFVSDLRSGLQQGEGFWSSFKNAALNALDKITDKLLNEVLDALFKVNSAGSGMGGSCGGLFGSILGGIGSLLGFSRGGYTGNGAASSVAGVVHGGEYVFSKSAVDRIGLGYLDSLHSAAKGYMNGGYVRAHAPANLNVPGYQTGGYVHPFQQNGNAAVAQRVDVYVHSNDEKLRVFVQQEADGRILEATPKIIGQAVSQSTKTVVPTMAAYQQQKAGGNYRG